MVLVLTWRPLAQLGSTAKGGTYFNRQMGKKRAKKSKNWSKNKGFLLREPKIPNYTLELNSIDKIVGIK